MQPFVRNPYNYDTNAAGDESGIDTGTEGGAKQSFAEECDINVIVKRFGIGYDMPEGLRMPQAGDFTGVNDFHSAMNAIVQARETFDALPATLRAKFDNDPGQFVDFATDQKNLPEMDKLGLLSAKGSAAVLKAADEFQRQSDAEAAARHHARQNPPPEAEAPGVIAKKP